MGDFCCDFKSNNSFGRSERVNLLITDLRSGISHNGDFPLIYFFTSTKFKRTKSRARLKQANDTHKIRQAKALVAQVSY